MFNNRIILITVIISIIVYFALILISYHFIERFSIDRESNIPDYYSTDKKVAIFISGEIRNIENCKRIAKYIIRPLNADVFVNCSFNANTRCYEKIFLDIMNPLVYINNSYDNLQNNIIRLFQRLYDLNNEFKTYSGQYDIVIRVRVDIIINKPIPLKYLQNVSDTNIYGFTIHDVLFTYGCTWMNDNMFIITPNIMDGIVKLLFIVNKKGYYDRCLTPEYTLINYFNLKQITVNYILDYNFALNEHHVKNMSKNEMIKLWKKSVQINCMFNKLEEEFLSH